MAINFFEGEKAEKIATSLETIADHLENLGSPEAIAEDVAAWMDEHITENPTVVIDDSLSIRGAAADAKKTGDEISSLKSALNELDDQLIEKTYTDIQVASTINSAMVNLNGCREGRSASTIRKYQVTSGQKIKLIIPKDYKYSATYQFQNNVTIPYSDNTYIIGEIVVDAVDDIVIVPDGATYLMVSCNADSTTLAVQLVTETSIIAEIQDDISGMSGHLETVDDDLQEIKEDLTQKTYTDLFEAARDNSNMINLSGILESKSGFVVKKFAVEAGQKIKLVLSKDYTYSATYQFQNDINVPRSDNTHIIGETIKVSVDTIVVVPTGATYLMVSQDSSNTTNIIQKIIESDKLQYLTDEIDDLSDTVEDADNKTNGVILAFSVPATSTGNMVTIIGAIGDITVGTTTEGGTAYVCGQNLIDKSHKTVPGSGNDTLSIIVNRWVSDGSYSSSVYINDNADHTGSSSDYVTAVSPVIPGTTYYLSCAETLSRYYILDDSMNIVAGIGENGWQKNYIITAPEDSKYLVTSFNNAASFVHLGIVPDAKDYYDIKVAHDGEPMTPAGPNILIFAPNGENVSVNARVFSVQTEEETILTRNHDVIDAVYASSRWGVNGGGVQNYRKQLSLLVTTDVHGWWDRLLDAVQYLNSISSIDAGCCLGDIVSGNFTDNATGYTGAVASSDKPWFTVIGNHDCGNSTNPAICGTTAQVVEKFITPNESKAGQSGLTVPYYYYDWESYSIRFIVMYDYESPTDQSGGAYIIRRGAACYDQTQINWLISVLNSTPSGYSVVILKHGQPEENTAIECNFTQIGITETADNGSGCYGKAPIISDIIDAWKNGTTLSKTYVPETEYSSLLNNIVVSADFTSRGTGKFICYLTGHMHKDIIAKDDVHQDQITIALAATAAGDYQNANSDLPRVDGEKSIDAITVVSFDTVAERINLVRVGSNKTIYMVDRTMISIPYVT